MLANNKLRNRIEDIRFLTDYNIAIGLSLDSAAELGFGDDDCHAGR